MIKNIEIYSDYLNSVTFKFTYYLLVIIRNIKDIMIGLYLNKIIKFLF